MIHTEKQFINTMTAKRALIIAVPIIFLVIFFVSQPTTAHGIDPLWKVLKPPFAPGSLGAVISNIWQIMMNLVNSLVLVALVYVAFMNILRIQLDSYAVKKILPTFIMAVILANFSFLISRIVIDIGNVAISLFLLGDPQNQISSAFGEVIGEAPPAPGSQLAGQSYFAAIIAYIAKQILLIVGAVLVLILAFIFLVRNYMLYFLVAIAPIGFMAMILPVTKKYFQMWWSNMFKWTFMPVVSVFWLWLAGQFMNAISKTPGGTWILPLGFAGLCFYMAITSPFKIGGAVVGAWSSWGKKGLAFGGRQVSGAGARTSEFGQKLQKRYPEKAWQAKTGKFLERTGGVINVPASYRALKEGKKLRMAELGKAEVKTPTYTRLAGPLARIEAQRARHEDEFKYAPPTTVGREVAKIEDQVREAALRARTRQERRVLFELDKMLNGDGNGENFRAASQELQRRAIRSLLPAEGAPGLMNKFGGRGGIFGTEEQAVLAEGWTRRGTQDLRRRDTVDEFNTGYTGYQNPDLPGGRPVVPARREWANFPLPPEPPPAAGAPATGAAPLSEGGIPTAPAPPAGGPAGTPGEVLARMDPELTQAIRDLRDAFNKMEEDTGGAGSLGGDEGFDRMLSKISELKPEAKLDTAGLGAALQLGDKGVDITRFRPEALQQMTLSSQRVAAGSAKLETSFRENSLQVWRRIADFLKRGANAEQQRKLADEGLKNVGETNEQH